MAVTSASLDAVLQHIDDDFDHAVERVSALLRIPSVSTDPAFKAEVRAAAQWLADDLGGMGFDAGVHDTAGHPMVVARDHGAGPDAPTILYYGHYDVQPPDPLDLWETGPFDPVIRDSAHGKKIVARGAVDDKGQLMTFVEAFRAWKTVHGSLPVNVTVMLEGEEESGSGSLEPFLKENRGLLQADVCVVCDTGMWDVRTPAITYMLRGMVYIEATLHGPEMDLHSGMYGGAVLNPINALTRILAELHDERGRVQIPGFYDDVAEVSDEQRAEWASLGFDEKAFLASAGLTTPVGEAGRSTLERTWSRPTCDINGIIGGYTGAGAKTVIGSSARAKISCRLVANQDPTKVQDSLIGFLEARTPPDGRWTFEKHGCNPAIRVPTDSPFLAAAREALSSVYGREAVLIGSGGSIPVVGEIERILGFDSLLVGFGLDDDRVHSPNEKFELACLRGGIKSHASMLPAFERVGR